MTLHCFYNVVVIVDNSLPMIRKFTLEKINSPHKMTVRLLHCENAQCSSVGTGSYPDRIIVYTIFRLDLQMYYSLSLKHSVKLILHSFGFNK